MISRCAAGLLISFTASLWAKGTPVMIELKGENLASPIGITDAQLLGKFTFWDGPGMNMATLENAGRGSIIDWKAGIVAHAPAGLERRERTSAPLTSARSLGLKPRATGSWQPIHGQAAEPVESPCVGKHSVSQRTLCAT